MKKTKAFCSFLIAEVFCVMCPRGSIVVVDLMEAFGQGWPLLSFLLWWLVHVLTFAVGLLGIFSTHMFFGNGLADLYGVIEVVPSKMLIFDVFMDIPQIAGFYVLGQPYFTLIQVYGSAFQRFPVFSDVKNESTGDVKDRSSREIGRHAAHAGNAAVWHPFGQLTCGGTDL